MTNRWPNSLSKIVVFLVLILIMPASTSAQVYTVRALDVKGDGRAPSLANAAQVAYCYDN